VYEPALAGAHRLQCNAVAGTERLLRAVHGERLDRAATPVAIARRVDDDLLAGVLVLPQDRVRERLHRIDRLAVAADQQAEVRGGADRRDRVGRFLDLDAAARAGAATLPSLFGAGGVRELRFGPNEGSGVFGISRRVIRPWPTVQRFVVTQ